MQAQEQRDYLPEEYLALEIASDERHEYIDGQIFPMTGGTPNHNQIAVNLGSALNFELKRQPYRVFITDQRLWIAKRRLYSYPDVMVVKSPLQFQEGRRDTLINPLIIAEVLSKSTKNYDRDEKFSAYRTIDNFQEYILIDQYRIHVEKYFKAAENKWIFSEYEGEETTLSLDSIPFQLSLADIYDKVDFDLED
ncbi:MAG: Uma2 family endonuclease [Pseudanabaenales cyanobacterium]|nr:Uma2 family endonuclease [Pseudanabaenales cyanobacterium]